MQGEMQGEMQGDNEKQLKNDLLDKLTIYNTSLRGSQQQRITEINVIMEMLTRNEAKYLLKQEIFVDSVKNKLREFHSAGLKDWSKEWWHKIFKNDPFDL